MNLNEFSHFVFGYGSLMCPDSRAVTAPTVASRTALPVSIQGVERAFAKRSKTMKATSMGVTFEKDATCVGVLVPVTEEELLQFDQREVGYDRYDIELRDINPVVHLLNEEDEDDMAIYEGTFLEEDAENAKSNNEHEEEKEEEDEEDEDEDSPQVWIYVQRDPLAASPEFPIAQTYVDVMLRGALSVSEDFAKEFIETTKGWNPTELTQGDEKADVNTTADTMAFPAAPGSWVDDRKDPLYVRADSNYSLEHSKKLDALLEETIVDESFSNRIRKGRTQMIKSMRSKDQPKRKRDKRRD